MNYKDLILSSAKYEIDICKHLYTKIPEGQMDWRPTEKQRSVAELLDYLQLCGLSSTEAMIRQTRNEEMDWKGVFEVYKKAQEEAGVTEFPDIMQWQHDEMSKWIEQLSNEDLSNTKAKVYWGFEMPLGQAIIETAVKFLTAYRMQLFLYAKQAGNSEIFTSNNWVGVDWEPPKENASEEEE